MPRTTKVYKVQFNVQMPVHFAEYIDNLPFKSRSEAMTVIIAEYRKNHPPQPIERLWDETEEATNA
jgi:hypothetical protein